MTDGVEGFAEIRPLRHDAPPRAVRIGRFQGVPIYLSLWWVLIAGVVTVGFADLFARSVDDAEGTLSYLLAFAFAVLSALCVLAHELGHAAAARAFALQVHSVYIYFLGGLTDIDPEPGRPGQEFVVAVAGPLVSAGLGAVAWAGAALSPTGSAIGAELELLAWSNIAVAAFNALPGLPLDGGRAVRALLWSALKSRPQATLIAGWAGRVIAVGIALGGLLLYSGATRVVAVVLCFGLGAFFWFAAGQAMTAARQQDRVGALHAATLVRPCVWVSATTPLTRAMQEAASAIGASSPGTASVMIVSVDGQGRPLAVVDERALSALTEDERAHALVDEVTSPLAVDTAIDIAVPGADLVSIVVSRPAFAYLALDRGQPVGVMLSSDLRAALTAGPSPRRGAA